MAKFTDSKGRVWQVPIHVASIRRVKKETQVDLTTALDGKLMTELGRDELKFAWVLWWLLEPQAKELSIAEDDLAEGLFGPFLDAAFEAFCEALIDFFRRPEHREVLGNLKKKGDEVLKAATAETLKFIGSDTTDAKIRREIQKAIDQADSMLGS